MNSLRKLEGIHGLRGCAAVCVVLFHLHAMPNLVLPAPMMRIVEHLYLSVLLFFVLSAFTLCHSQRLAPSTYPAFMTRRFFRIAPLFYLILGFQLFRSGIPSFHVLVANLTFVFNLIPGLEASLVWAGWAVGVEMLFYIIFPALYYLFRGPWTSIMGFAIATIGSIILWNVFTVNPGLPKYYAYFFIGSNVCIFLAGIFVHRVFTGITAQHSRWVKLFLPLVCTATIGAIYWDPINLHYRASGAYFAFWGMAFALLCLWQAAFPSAPMRMKVLQWLGDRSYSLYLLHPIIIVLSNPLYVFLKRDMGLSGSSLYIACAAWTFPVLFILAEIAYRLVEVPSMRIGRKISLKLETNRETQRAEVYPGTFSPP